MELQELSLISLVGQLRFAPSPLYPDVRGRLIRELGEGLSLPHWGWGDEVVNLHNEPRTWTLIAGHKEARVQFSRVEDVDAILDVSSQFFRRALNLLEVSEVAFVGVRTFWAAAVDSFEELKDSMLSSLGSPALHALVEATGTPTSDLGWAVECHGQNPRHMFRFGPMKREQASAQAMPNAPVDDLPESFLFLDLDRNYHEQTDEPALAVERWVKSAGRNLEIADEMSKLLTGAGAIR